MAQLRELSEWDEDYVLSLPAGELDWLEFKASDKFTSTSFSLDMSKYVSAWANYEGGYLVFGVKDPVLGEPLVIDGGVPLTTKPNLANWLDDVFPALVDPPLQKLSTWLVPAKAVDSQIRRGNVLVVIHIPESDSAPHQAQDRKYYQRLGRKLEPLRHRPIVDIAGRRRHPKTRSDIRIVIFNPDIRDESVLIWEVFNESDVFCQHVSTRVELPIKLLGYYWTTDDGHLISNESGDTYWEVKFANGLNSPLFPRSSLVRRVKVKLVRTLTNLRDEPIQNTPLVIRARTYADGAPLLDQEFQPAEVTKILTPEL